MSKFNASISVTELLTKTLENCAKELASRCIMECASRRGFDGSEEIKLLGLENLSLIKKQMAKKSVSKEIKSNKSVFPLPFIASSVDFHKCHGLAYNRGLFTQCQKAQMGNSSFCKGCQTECDNSAIGYPKCGTVHQRLSSGLYAFKDTTGRSPVSYAKILEKLKLTIEQAVEEAGKNSLEIDNDHFVVADKPKKEKKEKKERGRPKKAQGIVEAADVTDLFAKLTAEEIVEEVVVEEEDKKPKSKLTDEEKAVKKAALEEERAVKKAEREAKLAEEKAEKEAKRKEELEQKKAEREAKIAQEKAEREAKRLQEKAEKEEKKAAEKAAKELAKQEKGTKKADKAPIVAPAVPVAPVVEPAVPVAPVVAPAAPAATGKVSVSRITIDGKVYLKSSSNMLYDLNKQEAGIYDPETKTIKPLPKNEDDEEEVEDEYDGSSDEESEDEEDDN